MKITVTNLISLRNSLLSLESFKFNSKTTYTLSRDLNWVESELNIIETSRKKIFADFGSPKQDTPEYQIYVTEWESFINKEIEIKELRLIDLSDLNIGSAEKENTISVRILNGLFPILKDEV